MSGFIPKPSSSRPSASRKPAPGTPRRGPRAPPAPSPERSPARPSRRRLRPRRPFDLGRLAQVADAGVRAGADEHPVEPDLADRRAGLQPPCSRARAPRPRRAAPAPAGHVDHHARRGAPRSPAAGAAASITCSVSVGAVVVVKPRHSSSGSGSGGLPAATHSKVVSSGAIIPLGRRPRSSCCRRSCGPPSGSPSIARPGVLDHVANAAVDADAADRAEDQVLGRHAVAERALVADPHRPRLALLERLGGQHVLHLAGADPERERAEGAVRGGVRVAADDASCPAASAPSSGPIPCTILAGRADRVDRRRTRRSCARASLPGRARACRGSAGPSWSRRWARYGRRWRACDRADGPAGRPAAATRTPAAGRRARAGGRRTAQLARRSCASVLSNGDRAATV